MFLKKLLLKTILQTIKYVSLIVFPLIALLCTETGLRSLIHASNLLTPYRLQYESLSGALLLRPLHFEDLKISHSQSPDSIQIKTLDIELDLPKLWTEKTLQVAFNLKNLEGLKTWLQKNLDLSPEQRTTLTLEGSWARRFSSQTLHLEKIEGHWNNQPVHGTLHLQQTAPLPPLFTGHLQLGDNTIQITPNGRDWCVEGHFQDLHQGSPQFQGKGTLKAKIQNGLNHPDIEATFEASGLQIFEHSVEQLQGDLRLSQEDTEPFHLDLQAKNVFFNHILLNTFHLKSDGTKKLHSFFSTLDAPQSKIAISGKGQWQSKTWSMELKQLDVRGRWLKDWHLSKPATLEWNSKHAKAELQLKAAKDKATLQGEYTQEGSQRNFHVEAAQLPLDLIYFLLPDYMIPHSHAQFDFKGHWNQNEEPRLDGNILIAPGILEIKTNAESKEQLSFKGATAHVLLEKNQLKTEYALQINEKNFMSGGFNVDQVLHTRDPSLQKLSGPIKAQATDLSVLMKWFPEVARFNGHFQMTGEWAGTLEHPTPLLKADLERVTMTLPSLGVKIKPLEIHVQSDKTGTFKGQGRGKMRNGPGEFTLQGSLQPFEPGSPNHFELKAKQTEWIKTDAFQILASPDLSFEFPDWDTLKISGHIELTGGQINLDAHQNDQAYISSDVVYMNAKGQKTTKTSFKIIPDIQLKAPGVIHLTGFNLDTQAGGNLRIYKHGDHLMGEGRITFKEGTYQLPGQPLSIRRGRLNYPPGTLLSNPHLDIKLFQPKNNGSHANLKTDKTVIYVQGSLNDPIIEDMGLFAGDALSKALNAGTGDLLDPVKNKLGLSELKLDSVEGVNRASQAKDAHENNTIFVVGKQLSNRIHIQYLKSIKESENLDPVDKLRLNYQLGQYWALGMEAGAKGQGVDLSFSIEKD